MQHEDKFNMIFEAINNIQKSIDILTTKVDKLEKYIIPKRDWQIVTTSIVSTLVTILILYFI